MGHAARLVLDLHSDPDHSRWSPVPSDLEESRDTLQNGNKLPSPDFTSFLIISFSPAFEEEFQAYGFVVRK